MQVAEHIGTNRIYGIDIIESALMKAQKSGIIALRSDLNAMIPMGDHSVDVVFSNQVIEHLVNPGNFVKEMHRVLKPSGYAVICTENLASLHNILALIRGKQPYSGPYIVVDDLLLGRHSNPKEHKFKHTNETMFPHNKVFAFEAYKQIFEVCGFRVVKIYGAGYYPFPEPFSKILSLLDKRHAAFLVVKVRRVQKT